MFEEKGYIQFLCDWEPAPPPTGPMFDELRAWRDRLFELNLIGVYPNGIGYGNLSCHPRSDESFVITGTATGKLPKLGSEHLTEVIAHDADRNWLRCRGPIQASSESLSHAAVYANDSSIRAVVHIHHLEMWQALYDKVPTTNPNAEAGTPAMADAIEDLFRAGPVRKSGLFVMGGHREGLMTFGASVAEAGERLLAALKDFERGQYTT